MNLSDLLRLLALLAFIFAALLAFGVITITSGLGAILGWLAAGLALWVASTFGFAGRSF